MAEPASTLLAPERRLLDPAVRRDRDALEGLLLPEFLEFGSSGRSFSRGAIIAALAEDSATSSPDLSLQDFVCLELAPHIALVTYRLVGQDTRSASLRSSIWMQVKGQWRMRFHQGTRTGAVD